MMNILNILTGFYRYTEKKLHRTPGLNYKRKMQRLRRTQMMELADIKHFEKQCEQFVSLKTRQIIKELKIFIHRKNIAKSNYSRKIDEYTKIMFTMPNRGKEHFVQSQMEDAHGEELLNVDKSGNVLLSTGRGTSGEDQQTRMPDNTYVCSDSVGSYPTMAERWLNIERFQWKAASSFNSTLYQEKLPCSLLKKNKNAINIAPFLYHAYWQGDMEIKVQVNSNKFQIGQLQISWFYGASRDDSFPTRSNPYLLSQTMHGLLDAGACNEVSLYIPYKFHSPMMPIKESKMSVACLDMGTLTIKVLAPLASGEKQPSDADVAIWIRFVNSSFGGTLDAGIVFPVQAQMETALAVVAAEKALKLTGIINADNPPVNAIPTYVMPAACHALSVGTGSTEPLYPLRLDARGQNSGIFCQLESGNMNILEMARIFGLLRIVRWSTVLSTNAVLDSFVARPMLEFDQYIQNEPPGTDYAESRNLTPIAVVSSLFAQWRGSLEYRFDFIASQFHTGRIMIAYVPMAQNVSAMSMEKARSCYHVIFDLQETKTCTFKVPFVYHDVWCRANRKMGDSDIYNGAIGKVFVFVVNALRCPSSVMGEVRVAIYARAGTDFEVSIPIQPTLGLNYVRYIRSTGNDQFLADNETSDGLYVGRWDDFPTTLVLRWGTLPGRIANFPGVEKLFRTKEKDIYFQCMDDQLFCEWMREPAMVCDKKPVNYFCVLKRADTWVAFAFENPEKAAAAWNAELQGKDPVYEVWRCDNKANPWAKIKPLVLVKKKKTNLVEPQMERANEVTLLDASRMLNATNGGMKQYGESFHNVKDLCRRYQYFGSYVIRNQDMRNGNGVLFQFPAYPQGILINRTPQIDYVQNKCRDGIIPILLSAFKFYRGGIRFKIVIPTTEGLSFWVQHRPEITRELPIITFPSAENNEIDMLAYGYGSHLTLGVVNGVMEFEVPFYQSGIYGELGKREKINDDSVYYGNGLVVCGYNNIGAEDAVSRLRGTTISIFYSVADDFQYHTFQGFPPMIDAAAIAEDFPELVFVENQGLGEVISGMVSKSVVKAADDSIVGRKLTEISDSLTKIFKEMFGSGVSNEKYVEFSIFMGSQIAHLINNFTSRTMAIVIVSVFGFIGIKFVYTSYNIVSILEKILRNFIGTPNEVLSGVPVVNAVPQSDLLPEENLFMTYISAIFTALCIYFGLDKANKLEEGFLNKLKRLFTVDLNVALRTGNGLYIFLKNHFILVQHLLKKILTLMFARYDIVELFQDKNSKGFKFLEECRILSENARKESFMEDANFIERVAVCENIGRNMLTSILRTPSDVGSKIHLEIEKQLNRIAQIGDDLRKRGMYPSIRKRPFHIYLAGEPGVGKTVMVDSLAKWFCEEIIPTHNIGPNFMCTVDCGSRFWSQCNGRQPILVFDDLWAVQAGNVLDEMMVNYLALHSNIPFSPPMAAVEDKKMLYAPECVISTSNFKFSKLVGVENEALNRRRNVLVIVEKAPLKPLEHPNCPHCHKHDITYVAATHLEDFHHLQFVVVKEVAKDVDISPTAPRISYAELLEELYEKATLHRQKEEQLYDERVQYFQSRAAKMEGTSLEERLENEKQQYRNYFERLLDEDIKMSNFGVRIMERLKTHIGDMSAKFYDFFDNDVDNQAGDEAGPSGIEKNPLVVDPDMRFKDKAFNEKKKLLERARNGDPGFEDLEQAMKKNLEPDGEPNVLLAHNALVTANGKIFNKYFVELQISKRDMEKFLKLVSSPQILCFAVEYLEHRIKAHTLCKKNIVSFAGFYRYLKEKRACAHLSQTFITTRFFDGKYHLEDGKTQFDEEFRCAGWCVMGSEFESDIMDEWKNESTVKKIYYSQRLASRIPKILLDPVVYKNSCKFKQIVEEISLWSQNLIEAVKKSTIVASIHKFVKSISTKILRALREWCHILLPFLGIVATGYLTGICAPVPVATAVVSQAHNYDARIMRVAKPVEKTIAVAHQSASQQAHHVEQLLHSNAVWITAEYLRNGIICVRKFRCLMLGVRKLLLLRHYHDFFLELDRIGAQPHFYFSYVDSNFRKISGAGRIEVRMLDMEYQPLFYNTVGDCNLMTTELPTTIPAAKDIIKFFASKAEHSYVTRKGWLVQTNDLTVRVDLKCEMDKVFVVSPGADNCAPVRMTTSYTYDYEGKGVCGSILLAPQLEHPIIGIHVAGTPGVLGIAEPLVRETFVEVGGKLKPKTIASLELLPQEYSNININTTIFPSGTVGVPYTHQQSGETQIVPSLIAGVFPVETEPTPLKAGDERMGGESPLQRGASKHGLLSDPFPAKLVREAKSDYANLIMTNAEPVQPSVGVLTLETAIIGDPLIPELTPLQWTSSEGFPLIKERPKGSRSKKWLFDLIENGDGSYGLNGIHPRLKQVLAVELESRKNGKIVPTIFTDVCKDETLPIEKARAGKTRVFSTAPVQFVIAFRMYFGDFMAAYRRNGFGLEHGIGIDVNSLAWTKLARYLTSVGDKIVAGDYSHFGYTLNAQFVEAAFDIMLDWYDKHSKSPTLEEDQCVRACLKNEILNVHRLASNLVYRSACGIPSGFPATDIVNSMVNCMYIRAAWREITTHGFYLFHQNVRVMVYGDDLAMNVSDKYIEKFNTETLHDFFKQYNIKFTDIDKSNKIVPYRGLSDATFLKCHFRPHESRVGLYTAALDKTSVQGAANWIHKRDDMREATIENAKQCLELGHGHGKQYYEFLYESLRRAIAEKLKINFVYFSYEELDERRFGGEINN